MADVCCEYTYAGITINNDPDTDTLIIDPTNGGQIVGLDGAPVRRQVDDLAGIEGGDSMPALLGFRVITFQGVCHVGTVDQTNETAYRSALNTLQAAVIGALEGQLNSATNLVWTPAGGSAKSISCMYGMPGGEIQFGSEMYAPKFSFQLIAEDPTIS